MKFLKSLGKAVRAVVSVFHRGIDHSDLLGGQFLTGQSETAVADIFPQRIAAEDAEHPLKMIAGRKGDPGYIIVIHLLREMTLNILQSLLNPGNPVHFHPLRRFHRTRFVDLASDFVCGWVTETAKGFDFSIQALCCL